MSTLSGIIADGVIADDQVVYLPTYNITQAATAHDALSYAYLADGGGASAAASASGVFGTQLVYHLSVVEAVQATAVQPATPSLAVITNVTASATFTPSLNPACRTLAKASGVFAAQTTYHVDVVANVKASGIVDRTPSAALTASVTASSVVTFNYIAGASFSSNASASAQTNATRIAIAAIVAAATIEDYPVPNFVYNESVLEAVDAFVHDKPSGSVTAWAINTRTNAVTQYSNWSFNSFGSIGRKYLAADENGLYELNGARDLTTNVVADMKGGYFSPAGGRLAGFKGCYIAARGQGNWTLNLLAGDGRAYSYQRYSNPGLMNTKIEIGKGLRSSYFAWELIASDGQDFDLDRLQFVPMVSGRRI